jgi:hypothetical protein
MNAVSQPELDEGEQTDLFGGTVAPAYVPDPAHVRNRLTALLGAMKVSATWPWEPVVVRLHRERTFDYLCGLLPDAREAADWRKRIAAEAEQLDAAA